MKLTYTKLHALDWSPKGIAFALPSLKRLLLVLGFYALCLVNQSFGQGKQIGAALVFHHLRENHFAFLTSPHFPVAVKTATATGGNWNDPNSWTDNKVPVLTDDILIPTGSTIRIDADNVSCQSIVINGALIFNAAYNLNVYGDWTNNGSFTASSGIVNFRGASNNTISGTAPTAFYDIVVDKGTSITSVIEANGAGAISNTGTITLTNGMLKASTGTFQFNANKTIQSPAGLWVNGATVNSTASIDNLGYVKITAGAFTVGTSSGNSLTTSGSGTFDISGGTLTVAGRLENTNGTAMVSGGIITVCTAGNGASGEGSFHMSANTNFSMSAGTVVFQRPSTAGAPVDLYIVGGGTGTKTISGGTFQMGNGVTPASSTFLVNSIAPVYNFSINTTNTPSVKLATVDVLKPIYDLTISNQLTLNGGTLDANGKSIIVANASTSALSRTSGYVIGDLKRSVNATGLYSFPVGTANGYTPVDINSTSGSFSNAAIIVTATNAKHANNSNTTDYLNRYWNIATSGITNPNYDIAATYLASDIIGNVSNIKGAKYTSAWSKTGILNTAGKTISFNAVTDALVSISGITACSLTGGAVAVTNVSCFGANDGSITISGVTGAAGGYEYSIDGGVTWKASASFTGLPAGIYDVRVRDASDNTCTLTINNAVTITAPSAVTINSAVKASYNGADLSCAASTNGQITVTASGGTGTLQYSKDNGSTYQSSNIFSGLGAATYQIKVKDANGCTTAATSVTLTAPATISFGIPAVTNVSCNGGNNGKIVINAIGGTGIITYTVSPNVGTQSPSGTFNNLSAQSYTITATDQNGCTVTTSVSVTQPLALSASISAQTNVSCFGGNNGSVTVIASNGTAPYTYSKDGATFVSSATFSGLTATNYTITVKDANGCTTTVPVSITQPAAALSATATKTDVGCFGQSTGTVTLTVNGGTPPYTYAWSNGATTQNVSNVAAGTYTVSITDAKGCTATASATVNQPAALNVTVSSNTPVCLGNTLNLTSNVSGGTLPYSYNWTGPNGFTSNLQSPVVSNVSVNAAGTYSVSIIDANGCFVNNATSVSISTPPVITANIPSDTSGCQKNAINFITSASGSPAPTVQWQISTNGSSWSNISGATNPTFTISSLSPSDDNSWYRAVYTNACGSVTSNATHLRVGAPINIGSSPSNQVGCNGTGTVSFTATANGGNGLVTMNWQVSTDGINWTDIPGTTTTSNIGNFSTTYSFTPTPAQANYQYRAKFANNGCVASYSTPAVLTVENLPSAPTVTTPVSYCQNATAVPLTATASGNNVLVWYTVASGGTGSATAPTPSTSTPGSTDYYVSQKTVAGGCEGPRVKITVVVNALPVITVNPVTVCSGTPTTLTASGANTYTWSPATGLSATTGATVTATLTATTTYTVTGTDLNGCVNSKNVTITINPLPTATITGTSSVCQNATAPNITFTGANGTAPYTFTYTINGGTPQTVSTAAGNSVTVAVPTATSGSFVYTLVSVSDKNCSQNQSGSVTVTVNALPVISVLPVTVCSGVPTALTASGANTYTWSPPTGLSATTGATVTVTLTSTQTYTVTGTDAKGCVNSATVTVTVNPLPAAPTVTGGSTCGTGVANLSASGCAGGTLNWYTASSGGTLVNTGSTYAPTVSSTTSFWVSCTDANGCVSARTQVTATVNTVPGAPTGTGGSNCGTGTVVLSASGCTGTYTWYDAATGGNVVGKGASFTTPSISATTSYWVSCTSAQGCEGPRTQVTATINAIPSAPTGVDSSRCGSGSVVLKATGCSGGTLAWYAAASGGTVLGTGANFTTPSINATTTYYVSCTINGCESPRTAVTATINSIPGLLTAGDNYNCGPGIVTLSASGCSGTVKWYDAATGGNLVGTGTPFTTPSLTVTTNYYASCVSSVGCEGARVQVVATIRPVDPGTIQQDQSVCSGGTITLTNQNSPTAPNNVTLTYQWEYSLTGSSPWTAISGATSSNSVTINNITQTIYVRRATRGVKNGAQGFDCTAYSNIVTITVNPLPVVSVSNACIGGTVMFTQTGGAAGGTWSVNGGGTINSSGVFTPATAGCFTATYTTSTSPGCSDTKSFVVFPSAPVLTAPANTCNTAFALPAVPAVAGFTVQYSIDGGSYTGTPSIPVSVGCHSISAQYVLTSACGTTAAGATGTAGCGVSNTVNVVIFPAAPPAPSVTPGCGAFTVTAPASVSGFSIQYSFDDGVTWGANTPPIADNCAGYKIKTRYVTAACGNIAAGTAGPASCSESPSTIRKVDNAKPVLTCPTIAPFCKVANDVYTIPLLIASDNCSANSALTISYSITGATTRSGTGPDASGIFNVGTSTITWTVADECGNISTCTTQVTINPKPAPTIYHN